MVDLESHRRKSGSWDRTLLDLFEIPESMLPRIVDSSGRLGETSVLGGSVPIAGIAGDQQAALFDQGYHRCGMSKNTYGTGFCHVRKHRH